MVEQFCTFITSLLPENQAAIISSIGNLIAGLIVASIALWGVLYQLKHDRTQKKTEREMDLRKTVYLDAVEAMIESLAIVNKYTNMDNEDSELGKQLSRNYAVISKAHVIANEDTVNALLQLNISLSESIMKVTLKRMPLSIKKYQLKIIDDSIAASQKESDRMISQMQKYKLDGVTDEKSWKYVNQNFEHENGKTMAEIEKKRAFSELYHTELTEFSVFCFNETSKVSRSALPDAVAAIRKELELPLNVENYRNMISKNYDASTKLLDEFLKDMNKTLKEEHKKMMMND